MVVSFQLSDLPALGRYFKRHLGGGGQYGSMAVFHWRAVENYLMPGIINLIKDDEKIVSTLSNTPKQLLVRGREFVVAEIGDANTDPAYQRQGMLKLLIDQSTSDALAQGMSGVYSTPSTLTPSLPAFVKKCNFLPLDSLTTKSLAFPLSVTPFVRQRSHWLLAQFTSTLFGTALQLFVLLAGLSRPLPGSCQIVDVDELPADWEQFWDRAKSSYDHIFARSRAALTWRYFHNPNTYKFYCVVQGGETQGYLVYRVVAGDDIKRLVIADYLFLPGCDDLLPPLLMRVFRDGLALGVDLISTWSVEGSASFAAFKALRFFEKGQLLLIWFQNEFARSLTSGGSWHFTLGDSDNV